MQPLMLALVQFTVEHQCFYFRLLIIFDEPDSHVFLIIEEKKKDLNEPDMHQFSKACVKMASSEVSWSLTQLTLRERQGIS